MGPENNLKLVEMSSHKHIGWTWHSLAMNQKKEKIFWKCRENRVIEIDPLINVLFYIRKC